jgi:hypothetical protein
LLLKLISSLLNSKLSLISSSSSTIAFKSFKINSFLIVLGNNLFLDLVTILLTLENVASEGVEVPNIAK